MSVTATVNIPMDEFQALQHSKTSAEAEANNLREQIRTMKVQASDQTLLVVARAGIEIVRFAVSQLPPESTIGWPTLALSKIASLLEDMPDANADDSELAVTLAGFARECEAFEERRQRRS